MQLVGHPPALLLSCSDGVPRIPLQALLALVGKRHIANNRLGANPRAFACQARRTDRLDPDGRPLLPAWQGPRTGIRRARAKVFGEVRSDDLREQSAADDREVNVEEPGGSGVGILDPLIIVDDEHSVRSAVVKGAISTFRNAPGRLPCFCLLSGVTLAVHGEPHERADGDEDRGLPQDADPIEPDMILKVREGQDRAPGRGRDCPAHAELERGVDHGNEVQRDRHQVQGVRKAVPLEKRVNGGNQEREDLHSPKRSLAQRRKAYAVTDGRRRQKTVKEAHGRSLVATHRASVIPSYWIQ